MKKTFALCVLLSLFLGVFSGCAPANQSETTVPTTPNISVLPGEENTSNTTAANDEYNDIGGGNTQEDPAVTPTEPTDFTQTDKDMFTDRDVKTEYDEAKAVKIQLNGNSASASSNSVKINGSKVIIKEEATYIISGSLADGMLVVDAPDNAKLHLVFNGVNITSKTSAALYILEADKVFVTLARGTDNILANGGSFIAIDENNIDGALFSKQDLTLNGSGSLTITSPAGHGIVCKDDLVITGGAYTVNAASHGLQANDSVRFANASLSVDAGKDGIHVENDSDAAKGFVYMASGTVKGEAEGDGITASAYLQIAGGSVDLLVGGGSKNGNKTHSDGFGGFMGGGPGGGRPGSMRPGSSQNTTTQESGTSMKGLKAGSGLQISGGTIKIDSADDALHSNTSLTVSGGNLALASGDDGIHAEETLTITAGTVDISQCYEGLEALHIDVQGGDVKLTASDDGLNAAGGVDQSGVSGGRDGMFGGYMGGGPGGFGGNSNGSIKISGGTLCINSSGDGIDANGTLEISGGHITIVGPTQGDTATLDYDKTAVITGGTFIGTGSTMMAQSFSDSTQGVIAVNVSGKADTLITVKDAEGNILLTREPELNFARIVFSSPEMEKGATYTLTVGEKTSQVKAK